VGKITVAELLLRLEDEYGYPAQGAHTVACKLAAADTLIQEAFLHWWNTSELPDVQIEGYSVNDLVTRHNMKPIAAFLTLDWLLRAPAEAAASLARGHDRLE